MVPLCSMQAVKAYYYIVRPLMPRLSRTAALILKALSLGYCFGLDIVDVTGLPSGTDYPALRCLERDELVESKWEPQEEATAKQRPARRYYEVIKAGRTAALAATQR